MTCIANKVAIAFRVLITVALLAIITATTVHSQPAPKSAAAQAPQPGLYLGAVSCASGNCHGNKARNPAEPNFRVRLDEYITWLRRDRHANAYNVLLEDKAKDVVRHLARFKGQKAQEIQLCLNCHALPAKPHARSIDLSQGVSCEACHGPASGWINSHLETKPGTRAQSVRAGMTDVWSAKARAEKCLSCHLGRVDRPDQQVDHELIAAGHPDLKFELDNYGEQMPRHWASYAERANKEGREETEGARAWLVGQTVAFKMGLARLADRARKENWPEYAELDCYSCHHSLQENSWRQTAAKKETLGLPPWSRARFVMMRTIVAVFAPDKLGSIDAEANKLSIAVHRSSGAEIAKLAAGLEQSMTPVVAQVEAIKSVDLKQTRQFVDLIVKDINLVTPEIRSAEQAFFAVNTLATDIFRSAPQKQAAMKDPLANALDALAKTVESPATYTPASFTANMKRVQEALNKTAGAN